MRKVCSWCTLILDAGDGTPGEPTSHGICERCAAVVAGTTGHESLEQARRQLATLHPRQDPRD